MSDRKNFLHRKWMKEHGGRAAYRKNLLRDRLRLIDEIKSDLCVDCCNKYPPVCMDFDHVRGVKRASVSKLVRDASWDDVLLGIALCDLVCSNCHRVRTSVRGDSVPHKFRREVV